MKIVCLNVLGGKYYKPLTDFLKQVDADVFCFQEVLSSNENRLLPDDYRSDFLSDLIGLLPEYNHFFFPRLHDFAMKSRPKGVSFGMAIFVRKPLKCSDYGIKTVHEGREPALDLRLDLNTQLQHVTVDGITIFNFHGIAVWPKTDIPERLSQSQNIRKAIDSIPGKKILCGDFNLALDTKSIGIIEGGMRNLVREFRIKSTRPSSMNYDEHLSDYFFVSDGIKVKSFEVPDMVISDHLPLIVELLD